ncbi:hypothetical protein ACEPAI_7623 [Sanghuangporus weigelae]
MVSRLAFASSLLVLGAGLAHAQINISSECQSTLLTVASSSEASCLNVVGLASILTTPANSSLVQPINSWLSGACAQDPCSNQSLSDIVANITNGCGSDLSSLGLSGDSANITSIVQQAYPTVRDVLCLKQSSNDTLCVTSQLTQIEAAEGTTLSIDNIFSSWASILGGGLSNVPSYIICGECSKEQFNVIATAEPAIASNTTVTSAIESQCGSSFLDGSDQSNVVEGTGSAAPTGTGGVNAASSATGLFSTGALTGIAFSSLAAISSAFLVLA